MLKKLCQYSGVIAATILLLCACQPSRPQTSQAIEAAVTDSGFEPGKWWVPAAETITLTLRNQGDAAHDWTLLARPLTEPFDGDDRENILFQANIQPGESTIFTFTAPAMAGEYDVVSSHAGDTEAGLVARLVVVQEQPANR